MPTITGVKVLPHKPVSKFYEATYPVYCVKVGHNGSHMTLTNTNTGRVFRTARDGDTLRSFLTRASDGYEKGLWVRVLGIWNDRLYLHGTGVNEAAHKEAEEAKKIAAEADEYW